MSKKNYLMITIISALILAITFYITLQFQLNQMLFFSIWIGAGLLLQIVIAYLIIKFKNNQ